MNERVIKRSCADMIFVVIVVIVNYECYNNTQSSAFYFQTCTDPSIDIIKMEVIMMELTFSIQIARETNDWRDYREYLLDVPNCLND